MTNEWEIRSDNELYQRILNRYREEVSCKQFHVFLDFLVECKAVMTVDDYTEEEGQEKRLDGSHVCLRIGQVEVHFQYYGKVRLAVDFVGEFNKFYDSIISNFYFPASKKELKTIIEHVTYMIEQGKDGYFRAMRREFYEGRTKQSSQSKPNKRFVGKRR